MGTTKKQRAAIIAKVNANLAVDNLLGAEFSKKLDELYIAGKITNEQIIAGLKRHYVDETGQQHAQRFINGDIDLATFVQGDKER